MEPRRLLAQALDAVGRNDLPVAEHAAHAVLGIDPVHPDAWHAIALVALARSDYPVALDACDRAISVLPDHAPFHVSRARALVGLGRHADAERSARAGVDARPR